MVKINDTTRLNFCMRRGPPSVTGAVDDAERYVFYIPYEHIDSVYAATPRKVID